MTLKEVWRLPFAKGGVCISPDGQTMIAMSGQTTRVIRMSDGAELAAFKDLKYAYRAVFSPDGDTIAVKSNEPQIGFYSLKTLQPIGKIKIPRNNEPQDEGFCFSYDGKYFYNIIYTSDFRTHLAVYDVRTLQELKTCFTDNRSVLPESIQYIQSRELYLLHGNYRSGKSYALWLNHDLDCVSQITLGTDIVHLQYLEEREEFITSDWRRINRLDAHGSFLASFPDENRELDLSNIWLSSTARYLFCVLREGFIVLSSADFTLLYQHKTQWPAFSCATTPDDAFVYVCGPGTCTLFEII